MKRFRKRDAFWIEIPEGTESKGEGEGDGEGEEDIGVNEYAKKNDKRVKNNFNVKIVHFFVF